MSSPNLITPQPPGTPLDYYIVIHASTTCDEHGVYVTKDSAEVIELAWILLDANTLEEKYKDNKLIKPSNTPITPLCTSLTTLTWEHVRNSGDFREAIQQFDKFHQRFLETKGEKTPSFAFVTLDSWDLRVQLPREARDKSVVLPLYLQHSKTFDLRTEYQRWQTYHPESLPFGSSSLSNICAALEVEPVNPSAPIKHNLPFHLQALAPAAPRRAMDEAVTLSRVLKGLIRKSQPLSEHPDIMTRPMDSHADVRAFLAERSKVLHMSGLPHDTTQSELESWFTQYGGRPIAFWTLRTPDQHKPTGTGFAVFPSHEEAAESLCMNGRALNDKAIEVGPSSARVLDRAAEILQPFPPSKNRPRPGDWTCPQCGFSNFQRRSACFRCSYPAVADHAQMGYGYGYGANMMGGHHMGHGHGHGHGNMGMQRHPTGSVPFRAGDWRCGSSDCNYHNFAKNVSCLRCGSSRANAAVVADPAFPATMSQGSGIGMHGPAMAGAPAQSPYGHPPGPYAPGGGFHGQQFGAPPGSYGMPGQFTPMGTPYTPGSSHQLPGFEGRADGNFSGASSQPSNAQNTSNGGNGYGYDGATDPFAFLATGIGGLNIGDESRRNGSTTAANTKSPN